VEIKVNGCVAVRMVEERFRDCDLGKQIGSCGSNKMWGVLGWHLFGCATLCEKKSQQKSLVM
jgi:hypothetical protein